MSASIAVSQGVYPRMLEHARREPAFECCGLLAGREGVITDVFPATNVAPDPAKSYEIDPRETVRLLREFREQKLEFLGIYHSHPNGKNEPSERDIELAYYSEAIYFIVSPQPDSPKPVRAFSIREGRVTELDMEVL